jgi:hypothetical protein
MIYFGEQFLYKSPSTTYISEYLQRVELFSLSIFYYTLGLTHTWFTYGAHYISVIWQQGKTLNMKHCNTHWTFDAG